jgi:hypothetical protein
MGRKHELVSIADVGRTYPTIGSAGGYLGVIDPRQVASALIDGAYQAQQLFVEDPLTGADFDQLGSVEVYG